MTPDANTREKGTREKGLYGVLLRGLEVALIVIFALMVADVLWQVFSRYVIGESSSFTEEFARFALIWLTLLGAAYLNGKEAHLTMDFLTRKLSPKDYARRRRWVAGFMFVFSAVVMVVGGGNLVYTTLRLGQVSPAMGVPLGVVYGVVPVAGLVVCYFTASQVLKTSSIEGVKGEGLKGD